MTIGILTQALHGNYGGLLQNYALQQVLIQLGHNPITIDRHIHRNENPLKNLVKSILRLTRSKHDASLLSKSQRKKITKNQIQFKIDNIITTPPIITQSNFDKEVHSSKYDAFIVGSDQCWRPCYSANIGNYFLDFIENDKIIKIAYAPSFGVDNWEYNEEQTEMVKIAISKFNAISVREKSAIDLCKTHLNIKAKWVLDPTMLLGAEGFRKFIKKDKSTGIVTYLLEETPSIENLIENVGHKIGESKITQNLPSQVFKRFESLKKHVSISVESWIENIANAKFVITDSFHGAVFSILFNKPFIVSLNGVRGNTRIESLLEDFDLKECIVSDFHNFLIPEYNWNKINDHLTIRREESLGFLKQALS